MFPRLEIRQDYDGQSYYAARTREELEPLRAQLPKDVFAGIECAPKECRAYVLEP